MHVNKHAADLFEQPICADVWRDKYRCEGEAGYAATCARVVAALCAEESAEFRAEALRAMRAREIVPAGRILAGAGTSKRVTLINCFVSPDIQDSMATHADQPGRGIMDSLSVAAYTLQMGGGVGMDFSSIRPRGAIVKRTASISSGVLPFMDMWHYMSETIMSAGHRRGAMMGTLGVWHPDIEEFIAAKQRSGRLTNFNISVLVPDEFMRAVEEDAAWHLTFPVPPSDGVGSAPKVDYRGLFGFDGSADPGRYDGHIYKIVRARELWDKIIGSTYVHAEPGVIFIDRVNETNNLKYCEHIHATNPCGEQPLPANGDCNLGHTNLAVMVDRPFEADARLNFEKLVAAAQIMVRLLDNVLDVTQWPTEEQAEEARSKRRVGLGFTGLASALQQLGVPYGSEQAVELTRAIARTQAVAAYQESARLAQERGAFPMYQRHKLWDAPFIQKLPAEVRSEALEGLRNGVLLSIAPTGTTSLVIGNVSSGIEPVFAHRYRRKVRGGSGEMEHEYSVYDYGYLQYCQKTGMSPDNNWGELPGGFVTADQLTVEQHLQMAAAAQEWVDAAISKTINCPTSMTLEEFKQVYARAHTLGLKGCTTYRPDPRSGRGAVLVAAREEEAAADVRVGAGDDLSPQAVGPRTDLIAPPDKIPMQDVVEGRRYRIKWPTEDCAYYVVITDYADPTGRRRPFELFISTKSERHSEWVKAFSLLVTAIFRREGDSSFVVDELRSVFSAAGGTWVRVPWADKPKLAPSLVAAIGLKIEEHLRWLGMIEQEPAPAVVHFEPIDPAQPTVIKGTVVKEVGKEVMPAQELLDVCIHCGARAVVYQEGCATCHACGRSDCG
ncbi:MAG: adenosylcobalamin-dependent ribonucleoside-diphosphate reductase [Dehalococcoidia bacterium]|nr:adenosylcobalamin-dependent ribonucleoside-diphosphate reductase [Dehalococcoidia bacterium]